MKIAHVTSSMDRLAAGVGGVVAALSAEQQRKGHEVRVFGLETKAWQAGDKSLWQGATASVHKVFGPRAFGYAPDLTKALLSFSPDIIHLHGLWMYPARAVANWHRETGKPYVYSPHGMLSPTALSFSAWKKKIALVLFQRIVLLKAPVLQATTMNEASEFRRFGLNNPIAIVPFGIHAAPIPIVQAESQSRILSLGRFHPVKGLDRLVEAWAKLENEFPTWSLDLVGVDESGYLAKLIKLASELKVTRVSFKSALRGADRDACMAGAEIFVLPTRSENFALTVAESLMMGTPVIATKGAPWSGLVGEGCGWWIDHGVEPLIAALREAMSLTSEQRRTLGMKGREWMLREFTWESVADKILDLYEELI